MRYRAICKNREFSRAYRVGKAYVSPMVVLYVAKNRVKHTRLGLTATKKIGGAVQRNRARRVMRAALFNLLPYDIGGLDLVVVARSQVVQAKSYEVEAALAALFEKAGLTARIAAYEEQHIPETQSGADPSQCADPPV